MEFDDDELEEDLKEEEEKEENQNQNTNPKKIIRHFTKMRTTNLSSFPGLISVKENPQTIQKIEEKKDDKNLWIPDEDAQNCYNCGNKFFSLFNRKHHCRVCGNIFCKSCIETYYEITIYNEKQEIKACAYCLTKKRELYKIFKNNLVEYCDKKGKKIFRTKAWDYVKNRKKNKKNIEAFCGFNKYESQLFKDFHENLNKNYEILLQKMINIVLNEKSDKLKYHHLVDDWGKTLYNITSQVINNLSPSFLNLGDTININDYIKIKTLVYRDQSKCEVIDGYALRKNVCVKSMRTKILKPRILLLKGSLEGYRTRDNTNPKKNIIVKGSAIEAYMDIIKKKIEEISPHIIIVEGTALQKFQGFFATNKMNISLVTEVNIKKLERIARCVKSFVVPSPDLIGKNIVIGTCGKFEIQNIKKNMSIENKNNKFFMKEEEYHLMRFEGCDDILFKTIILSGPNKDELKELKRLMKVILRTARYLYCQKFLLKYFNMLYEPSLSDENDEKKKRKVVRTKSSIFRERNYLYGFDTEIIDEKSNEFDCIYMNLQNKNKVDLSLNVSTRTSVPIQIEPEKNTNNINNNPNVNAASLKESQVLKSTPSQCSSCSYTMNAYSIAEDEEKTLGQNILSFLEESKEKCDKCSESKLNHTSFIYKNNGRIRISLYPLNESSYSIDKIAEYLGFNENVNTNINNINKKREIEEDEIYSYGFCETCNQIVTPLVKLPEEILNFSATKFYQNILYNKHMINFGDEKINILNFNLQKELFDLNDKEDAAYNCRKLKHLHYRDIARLFITKNGVVKFKYEDIIKYKIIGSQLNTNSAYYNKIYKIKKNQEIAADKILSLNALESLKDKFNVHKNTLDNIKSESFLDLINKMKKIIDEGFERIEELKRKNDEIFVNEEYENIFIYNNYLRKYLLKIMNVKIISNKLLKGIKRIIKLIFFEEVDEINKNEQESKEEGNNNPLSITTKTLSDNVKSKDLEEINKENNKNDLSLKKKTISNPQIPPTFSENKLNYSNSSSLSEPEENEEDNNENNPKENLILNIDSTGSITIPEKEKIKEVGENDLKIGEDDLKIEEKDKDKDKPKEETSNNKLIDLSLKKSIFSINFFGANPELKEKFGEKHNSCMNEINKYVTNILELDKNEFIQKIIYKLNYYDNNHSLYSAEVNDEDICSMITYALTSDQYLDSVKIDNKNGLNEIKSEFTDNEMSHDVDNDLFCETSLLYDRDKIEFSLGNYSNEKISQTLMNQLISNENKTCTYELKYSPSAVFNKVFEKKSKKPTKSNTNAKINYTEFNQKLHSMNNELKNLKNEVKKIHKQRFEEIKKRFDFPKQEPFEEEKLPTSEIKVTTYYTKHFESFRILCGASYFNFLHSIIKSQEWSSVTGGKSKALFFKSWDEKFVVKCLNEMEFNMFIESCFHYFVHNNKYFFFKMPSSLVKVVGAYKIRTKKNVIYCVILENLNYLLDSKNANIVTYDLKGSEINRYIKVKENNKVLMDTNFVEDFNGEPLPLDQKIYTLFLCAISNDTKICRNMGVIDYSLLCIIIDYNDEENKEKDEDKLKELKMIYNKGDNEGKIKFIRLGVLDYFRKYTFDKQLETLFKTIVNKFNTPTVINPKKYDERFLKKLSKYFIGS